MKRQYVMSERAHFMCPNMHFGMVMEIDKEYNKEQVEATFLRMAEAHPFLKSLIAYEEGTDKLYYHVTDYSQINIVVQSNESSLWSDYKKISEKDWNVFENGMLRVYIYPKQQGMTLLFAAHHLLVDGIEPQKDVLFIIGDWNAKVGSQETPGVTGKFGLGVQNEAEQRLIEFCQENILVIANTLFQQHKRRLYTWTSPNSQY